MIHNEALAPLGPVGTLLLGILCDCGAKEQVVEAVLAQLLQGLLGERLDAPEVVELAREDGDGAGGAVVAEGVKVLLGALRVAGAEDDPVRLSLAEELLDGLETLEG